MTSRTGDVSDEPWAILPPEQRRFTVDEVRRACATLPLSRHWPDDADVDAWRPSASLLPIMEHAGEAAVVLTQRASTLKRHGGDWVLPGGVCEPDDATPAATAQRETAEELGVPLSAVEVAGMLDSHGPFQTGFLLQFFIGFIAPGTVLRPNPAEVAAVELAPLSALMAEGAHHISDQAPAGYVLPGIGPTDRQPTRRRLHYFRIRDEEFVWGLQGTTLVDLLTHLVAERLRS